MALFKLSRFLDSFHLFKAAHKLAALSVGVKKPTKSLANGDRDESVNKVELIVDISENGSKPAVEDIDPETAVEAKNLVQNCCNNLAACHFQWNNHQSVVELSSLVLETRPGQVKALYRRGLAYLGLNLFQLAERDLVNAHKADPTNRAVNEKLGLVKQRMRKEEAGMKARMSKMFD